MKKLLTILLITILALTSVFAAGSKEAEATTKAYSFGSDCTWPPMEYVDESGNIVGYEIDLIKEFSAMSGVEMKVLNTGWDGIFAGLKNGAYDAVASGVTVTEERKLVMDFTTPLLTVNQSILVRKDSTQYKTVEELTGKKVGVQVGTTGDFALDGKPVQKMGYDEIPLAVQDLINGNVDAVVCDSLIASDFVLSNKQYQDLLAVSGTASEEVEEIAIAVNKGNTELLNIINDCLAKLEANGTIAKLKAKHNII